MLEDPGDLDIGVMVGISKILTKLEEQTRSSASLGPWARRPEGDFQYWVRRLTTLEDLENVEWSLANNPEMKRAWVMELRRCATGELGSSVRTVMNHVFAPSLANKLSLKGHNEKRQLVGTILFEIMANMLFDDSGASRREIHSRVTRWLSGSRDRRSGPEPARRKRRAAQIPAAQDQSPAEDTHAVGPTKPSPAQS